MAPADAIGTAALPTILLNGQPVAYRLVPSRTARKLRIRVKPDDIAVIIPEGRERHEAIAFLEANLKWVVEQLDRARRLQAFRRPEMQMLGQMLFQGQPVRVQVIRSGRWRAPNRVSLDNGVISITCPSGGATPAVRSLENWLRKQARVRIEQHIASVARHVKRDPDRIYVMGQRTKWGNCSALGNLSFNWRLIMAPDTVLHYVVTHEMVHLAVPDHSRKFWLTVQSLCPEAERARQWLVAHAHRLTGDLSAVVADG